MPLLREIKSMSKPKMADQTGTERSVCEVIKAKPKLQWRSQDAGDARTMVAHALRRAGAVLWI